MNTSDTILLYWTIVLISYLFAIFSQYGIKKEAKYNIRIIPFALSFVIPTFFFAFTNISNDYDQYCYIFEESNFSSFNLLWIEPGYALLNALIKLFTNDSAVAISVIKIIELVIVYYVIFDYRKKINVGTAVLAFLCLSYLDSFCMLRINLAAAIILLALDFYENRNRKIIALGLFFLSCTIHYSCVMFIAPLGAYFVCSKKYGIRMYTLVFIFVLLLLLSVVALPVLGNVLNSFDFLNKYSEKYGMVSKDGLGIMQYVYHLPFLVLFIWYWGKMKRGKNIECDGVFKLTLTIVPFSLFYGTLGYSVEVIGRSFVFFNYLWIVGMPCFYRQLEDKSKKQLTYLIIIVWMLYRFYVYTSTALAPAGIESYHLSI